MIGAIVNGKFGYDAYIYMSHATPFCSGLYGSDIYNVALCRAYFLGSKSLCHAYGQRLTFYFLSTALFFLFLVFN